MQLDREALVQLVTQDLLAIPVILDLLDLPV